MAGHALDRGRDRRLDWAAGGYASLLREDLLGPLTELQRERLARIERLIDTSLRMVGHMLEIARADAGVLPVCRRRTDLQAALAAAAGDYEGVADRAGLTLHLEVDDRLPPIHTDPAHVDTIIGNLLSNAIKYTPRGGRVCLHGVRMRLPGGPRRGTWAVIQVAHPVCPATVGAH